MRIVVDSPLGMELANSLFQPPRRCQISLFERGEQHEETCVHYPLKHNPLWSDLICGKQPDTRIAS